MQWLLLRLLRRCLSALAFCQFNQSRNRTRA
jgi:hypothetical protein